MRLILMLTVSVWIAAAQIAGAQESNQQSADMLSLLQKNEVRACVDEDTLRTNPFPYKGAKVALLGRWNQVLSESEAVFAEMYLNDVPSKYVMINSRALIVAVVKGKKDMPMGGQLKVTELDYIDSQPISFEYWGKVTQDGSDRQVVQDFFWSCDTHFGQ